MSLQGFSQEGPLTYKNGDTGVISSNYLATLTSTAGSVVACGVGGVPVGVADGDVAIGDYGTFRPLRGRVQLVATPLFAITAGQFVTTDAGGSVIADTGATGTADARTVNTIGQAETAVTGDTGANCNLWVVCPK